MKKQLIMEKALELFAKQGFEATSVQQITEQCNISKGAFYLSFKSKDELILLIIDEFMMQFVSEVDRIVREVSSNKDLLYEYYFAIFSTFYKYSDFAKLLLNEQNHTFNQEFLLKIKYYDQLSERVILAMIGHLYGENITTKYDIMYVIKGFITTYSHLFLFSNVIIDIDQLALSLVEKTNLLAKNMTEPFLTEPLYNKIQKPLSNEELKEQILEILEKKITESENSDEIETFILLKNELMLPNLPSVIIKGLLTNIRDNPQCKWLIYLLCSYFKV